jgi:Mn2+/Fe2+ NRAMP family transporter
LARPGTGSPAGPGRAHRRRRSQLRGPGYFKRLGPGIVTGAADDDPSGIGTYAQVGAAFGFGLLWTTLATLPLAIAVQEATARLGLVTGKGLAAVGFALVMVVLEVTMPYHRYARVLRWLALSLLAYVGVLVVVHVDWSAVLAHTLVPRFSADRAGVAALLAVFGTTISPYLFFWQAAEEVEEQAERPKPADRDRLAAMRGDVAAGMGSGIAVMFAIMTTAAVTLGAHGVVEIDTAQQAAQALRPLAGALAGLLFAAGIVGTGLLAVPVLAGSTAYASPRASAGPRGSASGPGRRGLSTR